MIFDKTIEHLFVDDNAWFILIWYYKRQHQI